MNKKSKKNQMKKAMTITMASVVTLSQVSPIISVFAENKDFAIEIEEQQSSRRINVTILDASVKKVSIFKGEDKIETKDATGELYFDVFQNGDYLIKGEDDKGTVITEETVNVNSFEELSITRNEETQELSIISRMPSTEKIKVTSSEEKILDTKMDTNGNYFTVMNPQENGVYVFTALDASGKELGTLEYQVNDIPDSDGNIIIRTEDDLNKIIEQPSGKYKLESDITLTDDILKEIDFRGELDGNGYRISNIQERFFHSITNATIHNVVVDGRLAESSKDSVLQNSGFYLSGYDDKQDYALLMQSENTVIENSFVLADLKGKNVAGFVLEGNATIKDSYVSGSLQGKEVYGFGKDVDVNGSYISASLAGEKRVLFTMGEIETSFYDAQINDLEEEKAQAYFTEQMTEESLSLHQFQEEKGKYPQIKASVDFKKEAQEVSAFSVMKIESRSNLNALKGDVKLKVDILDDEEATWTGKEVFLNNNSASLTGGEGEIIASFAGMSRRFVLKNAIAITNASVGASTTQTTTQITYPVEMGKYYKVVDTGEVLTTPKDHEEALTNGWKIIYWDGSYTQRGLRWNHEYKIVSTDLSTNTVVDTVKTNYGRNTGKITLTGNYDFGETMTASIADTNTTKGIMYFESASTLDEQNWTILQQNEFTEGMDTATYEVTNSEANKYLRARFVTDNSTGYEGTLLTKTNTLAKLAVVSASIENKTDATGEFTLGDSLVANIAPAGKENEVLFSWYQEGSDEVIATGRNYTLKASDVNKNIYVKAIAKLDGELKGEAISTSTTLVKSIKNSKPDASHIKLISKEDITATLKMEETKGLYRYGIAETIGGIVQEFPTLSRANTKTTITNLLPDKTYYIYVQQVGEDGYLDSDWSDTYLEVKTDFQHVRGDVVITGNNVYNQELQASLENGLTGQTGNLVWYRLDMDGNREATPIANGSSYTLKKEDIAKKIEVVFEATGNYAGEISSISDTVKKEEKASPDTNLTIEGYDDTWIKVKFPINTVNEKYILGISTTQDGVPVEVLDNGAVKEFSTGDEYSIYDLQRDTDYYLFIRYASNETHEKSEWISANEAVKQTTNKKAFTGNIKFEYETNPAKLMAGQTLTARLNPDDPSFNYKGEWKWFRVEGNTEVEINDFTMTNDKQGTSYVIPEGTDIGTTYKVTFEANVGYAGGINNTSDAVQKTEMAPYSKPDVSKIAMETIDDSTIKVKMNEGEGMYRFWYKKADTNTIDSISGFFNALIDSTDGYTDTGKDVYSSTDVVIEGLERNTKYIVRVQRVDDDKGSASEFTYSSDNSISASTSKTEIAGNITITGTERYNETLVASYNKANYASTGSSDDTNGEWQWYRGDTAIVGAKSASYKVTARDVGETLKVEYSMPADDDFSGKTSLATGEIGKATSQNPEISDVTSQFDATSKQMSINITGTTSSGEAKVYYRVQLKGETAPSFPDSTSLDKWTESVSATTQMTLDSDGRELEPQREYVVYFIQTATPTNEGSAVLSKEFKVGAKTQTGTIALSGRTHVSKEVTATLSDSNNQIGEWHWYYSNTDYTNTNPSTWTEIKSGFSPKDNSDTSILVVPDETKGKYIKAKFISTDEKYNGSVENVSTTTVTKTFTEKLSISGKGYAGETLTVKLEGSDRDLSKTMSGSESPNQLFNTRVVQIQEANGKYRGNITTIKNVTKDSFQVEVPSNYDSEFDGFYFSAVVNNPDTKIYTKEDGSFISGSYLNLDSNNRVQFHYGIPITSAADFTNFLLGKNQYTRKNNGNDIQRFVLTNNINMSSLPAITNITTNTQSFFELNGDYHTVVGLKNAMFPKIGSVTVRNLIFFNSDVKTTYTGSDMNLKSGAVIANTAWNTEIENCFLASSTLTSNWDTGYFVGRGQGSLSIKNSGSAGGVVQSTATGISLGGLVGYNGNEVSSAANYISNAFSINTTIRGTNSDPSNVGGFMGGSGTNVSVNNSFVSSKIPNGKSRGSFIGAGSASFSNAFYDSTVMGTSFNGVGNGSSRTTENLIGTKASSLGSDWSYKEGFYPQLKWLKTHPVSILYAATRGAFTSVDQATSPTNMFNGNIYGPISVPEEFKNSTYSVASSNPNFTVINGTIIPTGSVGSSATITVTYTEPDASIKGSVSNTYDFTVRKQVKAMAKVNITGTAQYGER